MESMCINWEALDALVIDFAKSEHLLIKNTEQEQVEEENNNNNQTTSSSSYKWRVLIRRIRRFIESGDIDSAVDLLTRYAPDVLDDHRLLFRLQKQKFIELLRKGSDEDRNSAIKCARVSLAPCALDAYPEAYEEFKHLLLALIYGKDDQSSPVANEWSEKIRFDIAGFLSSVLRAHLNAYDPIFSMTLRYLISIHKGFCLRQGVSSPITDLTERLLLEERDPQATVQESFYEAPPFNEVDIQALAHAVEITRQGAVDSLRFAKGDIHLAFQNELCRMKLDISMLDELVHEYCIYRGIVDSNPVTCGFLVTPGCTNTEQLDPGSCLSENCSMGSDSDMSISSTHHGSSDCKAETLSMKQADIEVRYPCATASPSEDCSTSEMHQVMNKKVVLRNNNSGIKERGKRKRWRGRNDDEEFSDDQSRKSDHSATKLLGVTNMDVDKSSMMNNLSNTMDKFETILAMKELASKGMATEVVEEINALDPDFFTQNSTLFFQLKQVEFLNLVKAGNHSSAVKVASSHLGPLAAKHPALLKPMKETLLVLLRSDEKTISEHLPLDALATSLQVAVGQRFGIEEPRLMKIIRAALHTHSEWFKLQMCKDQFEGLLWINSLREHGSALLGDNVSKSAIDSCTQGSNSQVTSSTSTTKMQEDGSSPNQISSADMGCDDNAILKVMEFLALPRADAIHLLAQYDGNAEIVIQQIFA